MSSRNGENNVSEAPANAETATKRRKVSTAESTSSKSSSIKDDQISPSRASRRIAGKERSYSHKFGYGEDEAILLIGKPEGSPRKSGATKDIKEDPAGSKKRNQKRQSSTSVSDNNGKAEVENGPSNRTVGRPRTRGKANEGESISTETEQVQNSKSAENELTGEVTSEEQSSGDKSNSTNEEQTSNDKSNLANDADIRDGKQSNGALEGNLSTTQDIVETSNMNENVTTNDAEGNSEEVTTSNQVQSRRSKRSAPETTSEATTTVRRTRQTAGANTTPPATERLRKRKAEETGTDSAKVISSTEENQISTASLPPPKALQKVNQVSPSPPPPKKTLVENKRSGPANISPAKQISVKQNMSKGEYPNATKLLVEELKKAKDEQQVVIDDFRKLREEQQQVINDLRKHRDEQEKLIEDLRKSRNEKQAEVDKLHAQQRASSILFHRERDVNISRYMSDNEMSDNDNDNDDALSVTNSLPQISTSGKDPLTFDNVLSKVMCFTKVEDLTNCRLVSKHWNYAASSWLRKKSAISLKYGVTDFMNIFQSSSKLYPMSAFDIFLTEDFVTDPNTATFLQRYGRFIETLDLHLEYFYTDFVSIDNLRSFLPPRLPNLEHLVLRLPCKFLSKPLDVQPQDDYPSFLNNMQTKLKSLKVVCQCTAMTHEEDEPGSASAETHFQSGLLLELLQNSPDLVSFEFKSGRFDTNKTLIRRVVELLNRVDLPRLRQLTLKGLVMQDIQIRPEEFLPNYQLKSLHLSAIPWVQIEGIWVQHIRTLECITIGKVLDNINLQAATLEDYSFMNLRELRVHSKVEDPSVFQSFPKLFPKLRKLQLRNPSEHIILCVWKELVQLEELVLDFADEVQDDEKYKVLHMDSLLSGFSINNCELILKKIMKKGLPQNLDFGSMERFGQGQSIQNMRNLQKFVIKSTSKSLPFRVTEVGLVLVLLRMKSLTSITISPCVLMKDTMKQLVGKISPAISLSITCPEKGDDYESAKIALL